MFKKRYILSGKNIPPFKLNEDIKELDDTARKVILESLKKNLPDDYDATIDDIRNNTNIDKNKVVDIVFGLINLYINQYHSGESIDEFLKGKKYDETRDFFKEVLIEDSSIGIISKRIFLEIENLNILIKTNIITDFRPIFFNDPLVEPQYGMIKHTLSLTVQDLVHFKDIFITLDKQGLEELSRVVERARNKEKTLENACKKNKIKLFHKGFEIINGQNGNK
ncbi:MAG: hypothetical protein ACFFAN_05950 [Promethearchaeota archaeon]